MADKPKPDFTGPFDPDTLTPEEVPEAMKAIAATLSEACVQCFPTQGNPKRAELVACALLSVASSYAHQAGLNVVEWLRNQVDINVAHAKAKKASQN